jgi:hypothetical protein
VACDEDQAGALLGAGLCLGKAIGSKCLLKILAKKSLLKIFGQRLTSPPPNPTNEKIPLIRPDPDQSWPKPVLV